jgi:hypothetical protein
MRSTRDRDRLRAEQLGRLGWEHVRVWSTDLFRDPARDVARVNAAVAKAATQRAQERADGQRAVGPATGTGEGGHAEAAEPEPTLHDQDQGEDEFTPVPDEKPRKRRALRRKAKRPFEQTKDDTDEGWGEYGDESAYDRYLREQRPPHWGTD